MKPTLSAETMQTFPSRSPTARAAAMVSSAVLRPRTISKSFITGTGLKKCIPTNRSGLVTTPDRAVMEMEEVLVARMVSGLQMASS